MNTPIERLTAFRDHILATDKTLNAYRFEKLCGLSNGYFKSHSTYNNERGISADSVIKVKKAFPQLNLEWVLLGTGTMIKQQEGIPLYNIPFFVIPITINGEPSPDITPVAYISINKKVSKYHQNRTRADAKTFACISSDQAMLPTIPPGTVIILTPIDTADITAAHLARPFSVILSDGSRLTRHISTTTSRTLTLAPTATSPAYAPVNIYKKDVTHLFAVTASIQLYAPYKQ